MSLHQLNNINYYKTIIDINTTKDLAIIIYINIMFTIKISVYIKFQQRIYSTIIILTKY